MSGDMLGPEGSLTSKQLQRMVTALDLASSKGDQIKALEAELLQAQSKALLYEVCIQSDLLLNVWLSKVTHLI